LLAQKDGTMKYETPDLTALTSAMNAIQSTPVSKGIGPHLGIRLIEGKWLGIKSESK
jgi:hypothetical protein